MASTDIDELVRQLTLEEKAFLLAGADVWQTQEVPRLGIGSIKTTDGPAGARGHLLVDGSPAAFVPSGLCQAANWSKPELHRLGQVLCRETKTKAAQVLLAPTICCVRNPLAGRNFECFGEDPFLSGSLAVEYISGLQETGEVAATVKHFVANEQEYKRLSINAVISEKALREIYLRPFEMVIRSSSPPDCVMTAYNCVNGLHMDMNPSILRDILRKQWGFDGLVMSDWGGTNSTIESVLAGVDLEMPGPPERRGNKLFSILKEDPSAELLASVDESVRNILALLGKYNLLGLTEEEARQSRAQEERSDTSPEDIALIRKVAAEGIILLKNTQGTLPLSPDHISGRQVAFIGPNALHGTSGGGGSASMNPQYLSQPMDSFKAVAATLGVDVSVKHALGAYTRKWLPVTSKTTWSVPTPAQGASEEAMLQMDFFSSQDLSGPVQETQYRSNSFIDLADTSPPAFSVDPVPAFSFRITSTLTPTSTGTHSFSLCSVGASKLLIDGELVVDNTRWYGMEECFYTFGSAECVGTKALNAGQRYTVHVEGWTRTDEEYHKFLPEDVNPHFCSYPSVRIGYLEELPSEDELISEAANLADASEYTVVVIGLDEEWETEGYDKQSMTLPKGQDRLVDALLERVKRPDRLVIVNQSGSPVEFPWVNRVSALLQTFYGGQEAGNALADVLLGRVNPSGRLPVTWPRAYSDLSFASDPTAWPGKDGSVHYVEGVQVGYRYYAHDSTKQPQWWFGYGESYTKFSSEIRSMTPGEEDTWILATTVGNIGDRTGREVIQVYAWPEGKPEERQLVAFEKTADVEPKTVVNVEATIRMRDVARWERGRWELPAGDYVFGVGTGAGDALRTTTEVTLKGKRDWPA